MKNLFIPFLGALLAISCQKKDAAPIEAADPDWVKLEIPTEWSAGEQAYSLVGDIDHTLLVSTIVGLYATADQGKTWQKLRTTSQIVWALMPRNDTIFALNSYQTNSQGDKLAACFAEEFSTDFGRTWAYTDILGPNSYEKYRAFRYPLGQVSAAGYAYRTRENTVSVLILYFTAGGSFRPAANQCRQRAASHASAGAALPQQPVPRCAKPLVRGGLRGWIRCGNGHSSRFHQRQQYSGGVRVAPALAVADCRGPSCSQSRYYRRC